jgi:hypothetical protein
VRDATDPSEIEWTLWCTLMCQCDSCGEWLKLSEYDEIHARDPMEWAKAVTPTVAALGWTAPEEFVLWCPHCTKNKASG